MESIDFDSIWEQYFKKWLESSENYDYLMSVAYGENGEGSEGAYERFLQRNRIDHWGKSRLKKMSPSAFVGGGYDPLVKYGPSATYDKARTYARDKLTKDEIIEDILKLQLGSRTARAEEKLKSMDISELKQLRGSYTYSSGGQIKKIGKAGRKFFEGLEEEEES